MSLFEISWNDKAMCYVASSREISKIPSYLSAMGKSYERQATCFNIITTTVFLFSFENKIMIFLDKYNDLTAASIF